MAALGAVAAGQTGAQAAPAAPAAPGVPVAPGHVPIIGSGSSWVSNAVADWTANTSRYGIVANYTAKGSAAGRSDFAALATDFAVSDLTYAEAGDPNPSRQFATFPIAAGAVDFVYHVQVGGSWRNDIRLSGPTLADIFRGAVTNWNDPEITADNHGHRVAPDLPITPVIRSDGAATSYRVTEWFTQRFTKHWQPFSTVGATAYFPSAGGRTVAAAGSDGVVSRVRQSDANGAIGYAENSYAVNAALPVAAIQNASGHFIAPAAGNVSLALLRATTAPNGSTDLTGVYNDLDPRAYPLAYHAYGIVPTGSEPRTTSQKRQTLVDFFAYASCSGQNMADALGYAPLPLNLLRSGLRALAQLRSADPRVNTRALSLTACDNPTVRHTADGRVVDDLATTVPQPAPCTARDADPCKP